MADEPDIVQNVNITGVDEGVRDFDRLGEAGERAFNRISEASKQTDGIAQGISDIGKTAPDLQRVEDAAQRFGSSLRDTGEALGTLIGQLPRLAAAAGAAAGVMTGAMFGIAKAAANATDRVRDAAIAAGTTSQNFQKLAFAAGQSGASTQRLERAFALINAGGKELESKLGKIGVRLRESNGDARDASDVFVDVAEAIAKIQDPAQRSAAAAEIFGRRLGPGLTELLSEGRKGINALGKEAQRLGLIFTQAELKVGDDFNDSLSRLGQTLSTVSTRIGLAFGPAFIKLFDGITEAVVKLSPHIIRVAEIIGQNLTPAISSTLEFLGPTGTGIAAIGVAMSALALGVGAVVKLLGPFAGLIKAAFVPFVALARGAALAIALIGPALSSIINLVRLLGVVARVAFGFNPLVLAIAVAIGALIVILAKVDWQKFGQRAVEAWRVVSSWATNAWNTVTTLWGQLTQFFTNIWTQISNAASLAWNFIVTAVSTAAQRIRDAIGLVRQFISDVWEGIKQRAADAWSFVVQTVSDAFDKVGTLFNDFITTPLANAWNAVKQGALDAWNFVVQTVQSALDRVKSFLQPVIDLLIRLWDWAKRAAQALGQTQTAAGATPTPGLKGGGPVYGPGTSTSDSILARLSRGEFVVRAAAVRKYGLSLLHAINAMRAPRDLPGFSMGGLVHALAAPLGRLPQFQGGGEVLAQPAATGRPIVLQIGNETFHMISRDAETADNLTKFVIKRRLSSAGRKPGYYGG